MSERTLVSWTIPARRVRVRRDVVEAAIGYLIDDWNDPREAPGWHGPTEPGTGSAWAVIEALREALGK